MSNQSLTHWKKNNDTNYISGEDLQEELNGLKKDFPVKLISFNDGETFDQNKQAKTTKTVMHFQDLNGKKLYKGVLLNKTAATFFIKESGSPYLENWIGTVCNIYAQPHSRFGYVVRFKKYFEPAKKVDLEGAKKELNNALNNDE